MLEPGTIVDAIRRSRLQDTQPLSVFWVWIATGRDDVVRELVRLRGALPIVPLKLSTQGFVNPDSVMKDVRDVLDSARRQIQELKEVAREQQGIDLVLISRRELRLADTSSPIVLPEWFPVSSAQTATVRIEDLTWSATVALSDRASGLDDLRRILYEVDRALLARLEQSRQSDHRLTGSFWDLALSIGATGGVGEEMERIRNTLNSIRNPTGYRPSTSKNPTVVGRLWAHANRTAPDRLQKTANALTKALDIGQVYDDDASLVAVLNRPSNPIGDARVRWSFALIATLRSACQLVTAAAHDDSYPEFPTVLLRSTSLDIRRFLDAAVAKLRL